ncbi:zinc ribbon domain-containing protein [Streptomyces sp. NPDC004726]
MTLSAAVYDAAVAVPPWREGRGARRIAVHAHDEDSLTLAWQAGRALLDRQPDRRVAALLLATTTPPAVDGGNASVLAEALRLDTDGLLVQEYSGGLFASGAALASAAALVSAGVAPALVLLTDARRGSDGKALGSGAAALLVTEEGPVRFRIAAAGADSAREVYSLGDGLVDHEPAFTRWLAARELPAVVSGGAALGLGAPGGAFPALGAPDGPAPGMGAPGGAFPALGAPDGPAPGMGAPEHALPDHTVTLAAGSRGIPGTGHLGCAAAWVEAVVKAVKAEAEAAEASGAEASGADASASVRAAAADGGGPDDDPGPGSTPATREIREIRATRVHVDIRGGARYLLELDFTQGRPTSPAPTGDDGPPPPPAPDAGDFTPYTSQAQAWRDRREELRLIGMRCDACDAPHFPAAPACPVHGPAAELRPYEMTLTGRVLTRTRDHVFPVGGPLTAAVVELADGGRFYGQVAAGHDVAIGDPVELVLRRIATGADAAPRYFWKILPAPDGKGR